MEVRAKKSLGQHFLTDLSIARSIADALVTSRGGITGSNTIHTPKKDAVTEKGAATEKDKVTGTEATIGADKVTGKDRVSGNGAAGRQDSTPDTGASIGADSHALPLPVQTLEIGPGMGVLSQYLLERDDIDLKMVEIDSESVDYLLMNFPKANGRLIKADFLKLPLKNFFKGQFFIIGNFPYNISSQIFFKVLEYKDCIPQVVCMVQKEVAERIAEKPGTKTYGILSVFLQAWYDIEYLFTVGEGAFNPPPKVKSAVIRLTRNRRTSLGCDEALFKSVVKTSFNQRRKTLRNSLKPLVNAKAEREGWTPEQIQEFTSAPVFDLRPERLGVEEFIALTTMLS